MFDYPDDHHGAENQFDTGKAKDTLHQQHKFHEEYFSLIFDDLSGLERAIAVLEGNGMKCYRGSGGYSRYINFNTQRDADDAAVFLNQRKEFLEY